MKAVTYARYGPPDVLNVRDVPKPVPRDDGRIGSIVDRVYPMERAADAHRRVETERRVGAVVIAME